VPGGEQVKSLEIAINGSVPFIWKDEHRNLADVLIITNKKTRAKPSKNWLFSLIKDVTGPFLFYLMAIAAGKYPENTGFTVHIAYLTGFQRFDYDGFTSDWARNYLTTLIESFFTDDAFDFLPLQSIVESEALVEMVCAENPDTDSSFYEHLSEQVLSQEDEIIDHARVGELLKLITLEIPGDALSKCRSRLGPLFQCRLC